MSWQPEPDRLGVALANGPPVAGELMNDEQAAAALREVTRGRRCRKNHWAVVVGDADGHAHVGALRDERDGFLRVLDGVADDLGGQQLGVVSEMTEPVRPAERADGAPRERTGARFWRESQ